MVGFFWDLVFGTVPCGRVNKEESCDECSLFRELPRIDDGLCYFQGPLTILKLMVHPWSSPCQECLVRAHQGA